MSNTNSSGGIGFFGLLTILFIGLKLTGYVHWSWWVVLSPMVAGIILMLIMLLIILGLAILDK